MKLKLFLSLAFLLVFAGFSAKAQQQQPQQPDMMEQAEIEADRLQRLLDLEDWQVFYVDSTLKHDIPAMMAEYEELSKAKVMNSSMYMVIRDKWMEKVDESYRKIFDDRQWTTYLKTGAAKEQKARAKRRAKAEGK
jgi:hypothetical protein